MGCLLTGLVTGSPPRPMRLSFPIVGHYDNVPGKPHTNCVMSAREFESRHADQAMSDLPAVFSEVYAVQRMSSKEINRQKELLDLCRAKLAEVAERNADIEAEVGCVRNKMFMKEEWIMETNQRIKQLDSEITALVKARINQQLQVELAEEETELEIRKLRAQCEKMSAHAHEVDEYEKLHSPVFRELQQAKEDLDKLRLRKAALDKDSGETARILTGTVAMEIRSEVRALQERLRYTQAEAENLRQKIADERAKQGQIRQTMKVLEKRNCAQLTRVRRHVKAVTDLNSQRRAQNNKLRASVDNVARKLQDAC
ncbi:uncharacterized protein LOC127878007 isoform X2 [Dreissena polymorpha]|uniref:uncharacterized protein LOC127878007 isoform X2 n=1 Tax=Dreissena polymorpha TaxID=45954 RepID=UPI002264EAAA|nr:uncharacterized protein LOC127878007 isoform X2 [Dreissena polymorpha]